MTTDNSIITDNNWVLIDSNTGWPVPCWSVRTRPLSEGQAERLSISGGRAPQHAASTGRVYVQPVAEGQQDGRNNLITQELEYFPSVLDLEWHDTSNINHKQLSSAYTVDGVHLMGRTGGGFAAALATAFFRADLDNKRKLLAAFEHLVKRYADQAANSEVA